MTSDVPLKDIMSASTLSKTPKLRRKLRRQRNLKRIPMKKKRSMTKSTVSIRSASRRPQHDKTASAEMATYHPSIVQKRCKSSKTSS